MKVLARLAVLLLVICGCAEHSKYSRVSSEMDGTLFYYEADRFEKKHGISADAWDAKAPVRVPDPALVDMDSTIHILVDRRKDRIQKEILSSGSEDLIFRKDEMAALLVKLDGVVLARKRALEAYVEKDDERFIEARGDFGKAMGPFIADLRKLYPDRSSEEYQVLSRAAKDRSLATLRDMLQDRMDRIVDEDRSLLSEAESRRATLLLQAFLVRSGKEQIPLHLKGYDNIPEGQLQVRDRQGLNLSEEESQRLKEQIKATSQLARTLNQVKNNEISLEDGLMKMLPIVSGDLAGYVKELDLLIIKLKDKDRYDRIEKGYKAFASMAIENISGLETRTREKIESMPDDLLNELKEESGSVVQVLEVLEFLKGLQHMFSTLRNPEALVTLLADTNAVAAKAKNLIKDTEWPEKLAVDAETIVRRKLDGFEEDVKSEFIKAMNSDEAKTLMLEIQSVYKDIQSGVRIVENILNLLSIGDVNPVYAAPDMPEIFDVSIENLANTSLNLKRVPGRLEDEIKITATLKEEGTQDKTSEVSFKLSRYGHYARLSPSVVLVKPDKLASGKESFQFAPVVSWNQHYRPRPENKKWYAAIAEGLQPAAGIHAAFLPYSPDNNIAIGLGATLSFWNDRLQFGGGYNLMAESSDNGQVYFFVGSDLIGILQTIGIGQ